MVWVGIARPPRPEDQSALNLEIERVFFFDYMGYRLKEFVWQPNEIEQVSMSLSAGALLWQVAEGRYADGRLRPIGELVRDPFILGNTRDLALRDLGSWLSTLFLYTPPRIYFRPAEQRLLLAALRGLTDEELGDELGISLSAVKKTWRGVYQRAASILPEQLPDSLSEDETKRGKEKKQRLLFYVRAHMEELRPVLPPRKPN